jgi:hypothetical protein
LRDLSFAGSLAPVVLAMISELSMNARCAPIFYVR